MIWLVATLAAALGAQGDCEIIGMGDILANPPPAVIVLGERHGTQPDLARAWRVVRRLDNNAPVTLALQAVDHDLQPVLDRFARGEMDPEALEGELYWGETWGFPWRPYQPLVTAELRDVHVVGIGDDDVEPPPDDAEFPVPGGYMSILRDALGDNSMPLGLQSGFVRTFAWQDHQVASRALQAWDGDGYLVILVARAHVAGGKGVGWQAGLITEHPVESYLLAWGGDPACYRADQIWRQTIWEKIAQPG